MKRPAAPTGTIALVGSLAALLALAGCGGGGSSNKSSDAQKQIAALVTGTTQPSSDTIFPGQGTSTTVFGNQGPPIGKIRIANLIWVDGAPGPAVDLYDTNRPGPTTTPIIKDLAFGTVSDYVSPRGFVAGDTTSNLYAYPAGTLTPTKMLNGSNIDNAGFEAGDQLTIALTASSGGLDGIGSMTMAEAGQRLPSGTAPSVPAGKGALLVRSVPDQTTDGSPSEYLVVNGTCLSPSDVGATGTSPVGLGDPAGYSVHAAGSIKLGVVVSSAAGQGLTTCAGKTATDNATVDLAAGGQVDVFVYGDPKAPKLVAAPVAH